MCTAFFRFVYVSYKCGTQVLSTVDTPASPHFYFVAQSFAVSLSPSLSPSLSLLYIFNTLSNGDFGFFTWYMQPFTILCGKHFQHSLTHIHIYILCLYLHTHTDSQHSQAKTLINEEYVRYHTKFIDTILVIYTAWSSFIRLRMLSSYLLILHRIKILFSYPSLLSEAKYKYTYLR